MFRLVLLKVLFVCLLCVLIISLAIDNDKLRNKNSELQAENDYLRDDNKGYRERLAKIRTLTYIRENND
jgi:cell division protein FtsB